MKRKKKGSNQNDARVIDIMNAMKGVGKNGEIQSDIEGSYSGMAKDDERPVQDADDL